MCVLIHKSSKSSALRLTFSTSTPPMKLIELQALDVLLSKFTSSTTHRSYRELSRTNLPVLWPVPMIVMFLRAVVLQDEVL